MELEPIDLVCGAGDCPDLDVAKKVVLDGSEGHGAEDIYEELN